MWKWKQISTKVPSYKEKIYALWKKIIIFAQYKEEKFKIWEKPGDGWKEEEGEFLISFHLHQYDKTQRKIQVQDELYMTPLIGGN